MQTEPIGFKGTKGMWELVNFPPNGQESLDGHFCIGVNDFCSDTPWSVAAVFSDSEGDCESNAKLITASKKMAIALQNILDDSIIREDSNGFLRISIRQERIAEAKEALKEAGLND